MTTNASLRTKVIDAGAAIVSAGNYAWNMLKPLTNEQLLAQGEKILGQDTRYKEILSLAHRDISRSPAALSRETLFAAESLYPQSVSRRITELKNHSDILSKRIASLQTKTDRVSELISTGLKAQQEQTQALIQELPFIVALELIARGEKIIAESAAYQGILSVLLAHQIHSPKDLSAEAITDLSDHAMSVEKMVQSEQLWLQHRALLYKAIRSIPGSIPISKLIMNVMQLQQEQLGSLLRYLRVIRSAYHSNQAYFSHCSLLSTIHSEYSHELSMLASKKSEDEIARMIANASSHKDRKNLYPHLAYVEKITRDIQALTPQAELSSRYPIMAIKYEELRTDLDEIKALIQTTPEYWKNAFANNKSNFENYKHQLIGGVLLTNLLCVAFNRSRAPLHPPALPIAPAAG